MTTALLVIDVQESFREQPSWASTSNTAIAADVARLAAHPLALHDGSGTLPAADAITRAAAALSGRFATITTIDEVHAS